MPTAAELLAQARALHVAGHVQQAELLYRQVIAAEAANVDAHYLLGAACQGLGRLDEAVASLRQALRLKPDHADAHHHLGVTLAHQGKLDESIASVREALRLKPSSAEIATNLRELVSMREKQLATQFTQQGNPQRAAECYHRVLELKPDDADTHNNLGAALRVLGRPDEAAACYQRALELNPHLAEAHFNLGAILADENRPLQAIGCYQRAIKLKPDFAPAHNNLGSALKRLGRASEALACYRRALQLNPDYAEAHNNLGVALMEQEKFVEAEACFRRGIELKPDVVTALNNLGMALQNQQRLSEAETCHRRAIELAPEDAEGHNNLGTALAQQMRLDEADECWRRAIELKADHAAAHHNRALALLLLGHLAEGWPEYEWRFELKDHKLPPLGQPRWKGEPLRGQTILLRSEQGMGDTLQFVRYAPLVQARGGGVTIECPSPLVRLVASCRGVDSVVAKGETLPAFDLHVPLLSLPGCFGTTLEDIPADVPYLEPDVALVDAWRAELAEHEGFKIGIAWHGSPAHPRNRVRSFPLSCLSGIAALEGVRLVSLQMGAGREQLADFTSRLPIVDLGDRLGDFHNTAAIVRNLDLVITCDSAPAHLGGALGASVWVALALVPDWRWLLERGDSPWYPTMRLFRQSAAGDWASVFGAMEAELKKVVRRAR